MNRPRRVSVTAPGGPAAASAHLPGPPAADPAVLEGARRVRRAQLRRAAVTVTLGALLLFGLPVLLRAAPGLAAVRLFGVPSGWLAVAIAPFPLLAGLAWWHLTGAERDEREDDVPRRGAGRDDRTGRSNRAGRDDRVGRDDEVGRAR